MENIRIGTPIKESNWDKTAHWYSMMTLLEVNGTNKQLDCLPLEPDMVVLDCGCGPGRVAIQLAKRVKKVIALDSSVGMLEECKKNCEAAGVTNVEFVYADWQETEIGKTIPEVDMVIQSRGGGGASTFEMLQKASRKYAATIMWTKGAPNVPTSRAKLFEGCFDDEDEMKPKRPPMRPSPIERDGKLPMGSEGLKEELIKKGIEVNVTTVDEGWDATFSTKEEAYERLLTLTDKADKINMEQFRKNVDKFLTPCEDGFYFLLPTQSDVSWFKTR